MGSFDSLGLEIIANSTLETGKQTALSIVVTNSYNEPRSFIALLEIRDQNVFQCFSMARWKFGTIWPDTDMGTLWIQSLPCDYEIRTFIISDLVNPQFLSDITSSTVTIS